MINYKVIDNLFLLLFKCQYYINYLSLPLVLLCFFFVFPKLNRAQVSVGTQEIDSNAAFQINSPNKGLLIPRLTNSQRNGILNPVNGLLIYNSTVDSFQYAVQSTWKNFAALPIATLYQNDGSLVSNRIIHLNDNNLSWMSGSNLLMKFTPSGSIGIHHNNPSAQYKLDVNGDARFAGVLYTQAVVLSSDARLKREINPIVNPVSELLKVNGYSYFWKDSLMGKTMQYGFVAQEIESLFPSLVYENANGTKAVNYTAMIPILLEAIKQQQKQIDALEAKLKDK